MLQDELLMAKGNLEYVEDQLRECDNNYWTEDGRRTIGNIPGLILQLRQAFGPSPGVNAGIDMVRQQGAMKEDYLFLQRVIGEGLYEEPYRIRERLNDIYWRISNYLEDGQYPSDGVHSDEQTLDNIRHALSTMDKLVAAVRRFEPGPVFDLQVACLARMIANLVSQLRPDYYATINSICRDTSVARAYAKGLLDEDLTRQAAARITMLITANHAAMTEQHLSEYVLMLCSMDVTVLD